MQEGKEGRPKKKRLRTSDADKGGDKAKRGAKGSDKAARGRSRRSVDSDGIAGVDDHSGPVAAGDKSGILDEDLSDDMKEHDADRAFIDDEGRCVWDGWRCSISY